MTILTIILTAAAMAADPPQLTGDEKAALLAIDLKAAQLQVKFEQAAGPFRAQFAELDRDRQAAVARIVASHKMPPDCTIRPSEQTISCPPKEEEKKKQ